MEGTLYSTALGKMIVGDTVELIDKNLSKYYKDKIQLLITSPPFPLNAKKKYGNHTGDEYVEWFASLGPLFSSMIRKDGSIVIEMGNSWEPNRPIQSTLHMESLLAFIKKSGLQLIQEFICYNPSRLPSPAAWVTTNRIRTVDSYTHVWWIGKSDHPKADNAKVLRPYSKGMKDLLKRQDFNKKARPSGHNINKKAFLKDNGGSIAHNLLEFEPIEKNRKNRLPNVLNEKLISDIDVGRYPHNVLSLSNTGSQDHYSRLCRENGVKRHPATIHPGLIAFFTHYLTDEDDIVFDPFAGSNTTGYVAEILNRRWISTEVSIEYAEQSKYRFNGININIENKP